jgi:hypothetical protein
MDEKTLYQYGYAAGSAKAVQKFAAEQTDPRVKEALIKLIPADCAELVATIDQAATVG